MLFFLWFVVLFNLATICYGDDTRYLGHPAAIGDFNYVAFVFALPCKRCGGSIISENHILTAAHCVDCTPKENIIVKAGKIHTQEWTGVYRRVQDVYIRSGYSRGIQNPSCPRMCYMWLSQWYNGPIRIQKQSVNDIAVLMLREPITLEGNIGKVSLPQPSIPLDDSCALCFVTMWQEIKDDERHYYRLYWARYIILSDEECKELDTIYRDTQFCAIDITMKTTMMKGHSGGALVCDGIIVGIASMSKLTPLRPTIFQNVSVFRDFIDEKMALGAESIV